MDSQPTTRERLIEAATSLFADRGFLGADVRSICNIARVNPGAVSYHFGGKRQLYRAVLRAAVDTLADAVTAGRDDDMAPVDLRDAVVRLDRHLSTESQSSRLLQRDLADGGQMALEALAPVLRSARAAIAAARGDTGDPLRSRDVTRIALAIAAPLWLAASTWPTLERSLHVDETDRRALIEGALDILDVE